MNRFCTEKQTTMLNFFYLPLLVETGTAQARPWQFSCSRTFFNKCKSAFNTLDENNVYFDVYSMFNGRLSNVSNLSNKMIYCLHHHTISMPKSDSTAGVLTDNLPLFTYLLWRHDIFFASWWVSVVRINDEINDIFYKQLILIWTIKLWKNLEIYFCEWPIWLLLARITFANGLFDLF